MEEQVKKRQIYVGTAQKLSANMRSFLEQRYIVTEILFKDMLKDSKSVHLILYGGGPDVSPALYGESKVGKYTQSDPERDKLFQTIFDVFYSTPKLGICGGAQFLTAASGGKLIQHVEGHTAPHDINVHFEGNTKPTKLKMTSTHHQMMYPFDMKKTSYQLLGWASRYQSLLYLDGENKQIALPTKFVEPEIIYFKNCRGLAIQGHPEHSDCNSNTQEVCLNLIEDYLV